MKKERSVTVLRLVVNTLVTLVKIYGGMVFSSYTLIVSGYYTLIDMLEEFNAYIASVVRGRRTNTKEPFGFGLKECFTLIFFGSILILVAIYIIIKSFFLNYINTDLRLAFVVCVISICLLVIAKLTFKNAKEIQSEMLMDCAHNTYFDAVFTFTTIIFIVLSLAIPKFDLIGSIFVAILIFYKGLAIIFYNILLIKGQNDNSKVIAKSIKKIVDNIKGITFSNVNLININNFYKATLEILVDEELSLGDLIHLENRIKRKIKWDNKDIKLVEFITYKK